MMADELPGPHCVKSVIRNDAGEVVGMWTLVRWHGGGGALAEYRVTLMPDWTDVRVFGYRKLVAFLEAGR